MRRAVPALLGAALGATLLAAQPSAPAFPQSPDDVRVVVATLDTGVNPLHPTHRREGATAHPSTYLEGFPADAPAARLTMTDDFEADLEDSQEALEAFAEGFAWVPGTQIIGAWSGPGDEDPVFTGPDGTQYHGGPAASQIAGAGYGFSEEALLLIMDRSPQGASDPDSSIGSTNAAGLRWAADQPWVDVIHTNIQNPVPLAPDAGPFPGYADAVAYSVSMGKVVVSAGGNFYALPTETSPHAGPSGVLVVGANDNCGGPTDFSNPDPHVVSDGYETVAADPDGYGEVSFGGTSSASPRVAGYVAELILRVRREVGHVGGITEGALVLIADEAKRPAAGPLADGRLDAPEVHEIVRRTAEPDGHESRFDGGAGTCIPLLTSNADGTWYAKMGYGEVSEHTIDLAVDVALGRTAMPERPGADRMYDASEELRRRVWG